MSQQKVKQTGGGTYNPEEKYLYFYTTDPTTLAKISDLTANLLVPVDELDGNAALRSFNQLISTVHPRTGKRRMFLDSGVFNLAVQHSNNHGITLNEARAMNPQKVDGYSALFDKYVELVRTYEETLWGYVEIDLGQTEDKRQIRRQLESMGLRPVPVYHPLSDGWDYFDELASQYDRICVGNMVQVRGYIRKRIIATIWQRKQAYPHLWVHLLGATPKEWMIAYPIESSDSALWLALVRLFNSSRGHTCLKELREATMPRGYAYEIGNFNCMVRGYRVSAQEYEMNRDNWENIIRSVDLLRNPT